MLFDDIAAKLLPVVMGPGSRSLGSHVRPVGVTASAAKQSIVRLSKKAGLLRCARNDGIKGHTPTATHTSAFSRRECAGVVQEFPPFPWEGRGECRVPTHPQPRMQSKKAYELVTTGRPGYPA